MLAVLLCLRFSLVAFSHPNVPVFLWSGEKYFGDTAQSHVEANEALYSAEFIKDFVSIFGHQKNEVLGSSEDSHSSFQFSKYVSKNMKIAPQVIVAFILPKLDSSEVALSNGAFSLSSVQSSMPLSFLKASVVNSKSSLIVPHLLIDSPFAMPISQQLSTSMASKYEVISFDSSSLADCLQFRSRNIKNERIFLVVKGDLQMSACAKKIMETVASVTPNYVTLMTGDAPREYIVHSFSGQEEFLPYPLNLAALTTTPASSTTANTAVVHGVLYLTSNILIALLLGLMLIFILLCGVNSLFNIETPQRLSHMKYNIGKQS